MINSDDEYVHHTDTQVHTHTEIHETLTGWQSLEEIWRAHYYVYILIYVIRIYNDIMSITELVTIHRVLQEEFVQTKPVARDRFLRAAPVRL